MELHNLLWIMAGDFNEPLVEEDKFRGRGINVNRSFAFKDCHDRCSMVDMGFSGPRFTLTNKKDISNLILERIDRFFMNPSWCVLYPDAKVTHLPRCHSNHYLVLMEALPTKSVNLTKPFRFQEFWLSDISFPTIESFSRETTTWNRNHFGNIHHKKKKNIYIYIYIARIYGVQKALSNNLSNSLINLENHL